MKSSMLVAFLSVFAAGCQHDGASLVGDGKVSDGSQPDGRGLRDGGGSGRDGSNERDGTMPDATRPDATPIDAGVPDAPWIELADPGIDLQGGAALAAVGRDGGRVRLRAHGQLTIDPASTSVAMVLPPTPVAGTLVTTADLATDLTHDGHLLLIDNVRATGSDPVRVITTPTGDIVVSGHLISADLGTVRQALVLRAPGGTVFVEGSISTGGLDGELDGDAGGDLVIEALRIVVRGAISTAGERGLYGRGGAGGALTIVANEPSFLGGSIDTLGGDATGAVDGIGGHGGAVTLSSASDLEIAATIRVRGGAAVATGGPATGGDAGVWSIDVDDALRLGGILDGRGGFATSELAGALVAGGAAAELRVGDHDVPSLLTVMVPVRANGGAGASLGGNGGAIDASAGAIRLAGAMDGVGGVAAQGGRGSIVTMVVVARTGAIVVDPGGAFVVDGGDATGGGRGGDGGDLLLQTIDGDVSMSGRLLARGGDASGSGSRGGAGGGLEIFCDANFDGNGGDIAIETTGLVDVSGGGGAIGGSARNDGADSVATFPDHTDEIAVLLNSDGMHGTPDDATLINRGRIVAGGGGSNGAGGDLMFHGRQPGNNDDPVSGDVDLSGQGSGDDGDFAGS